MDRKRATPSRSLPMTLPHGPTCPRPAMRSMFPAWDSVTPSGPTSRPSRRARPRPERGSRPATSSARSPSRRPIRRACQGQGEQGGDPGAKARNDHFRRGIAGMDQGVLDPPVQLGHDRLDDREQGLQTDRDQGRARSRPGSSHRGACVFMPLVQKLPPQSIAAALRRGWDDTIENILSIYGTIRNLVLGRLGPRGLAGPIRIVGYRLQVPLAPA